MRSQIVAYFSEIKKINYRRGMIIDNYDYDNPADCIYLYFIFSTSLCLKEWKNQAVKVWIS